MSSLRLNNVPVCCASAGQTVTFKLSEGPVTAVTPVDDSKDDTEFRVRSNSWLSEGRRRASAAGLVLLSSDAVSNSGDKVAPQAHWEFEAELLVLNHPSKIRANYEPVVHVGCVRQAAKLISVRKMNKTGSTGEVGKEGKETVVGSDELGNGERGLCR